MKSREKEVSEIEEALIRFHRRHETFQAPPFWTERLMARVREEQVRGNGFHRAGGVVWRFASVTCLASVLLAFYASGLDVRTPHEIVELMFDDPAGMDLAFLFAGL